MKKTNFFLLLAFLVGLSWQMNAQVTSFPWNEDFENAGAIPVDWTQEYVSGTVDYTFETGGHTGHPADAHGGLYNALFYSGNYNGDQTKLVTPVLDLSGLTTPVLSFWHAQTEWAGDQDELRVYYRANANDPWTLIPGQEYTANIDTWTQELYISLPNPSSTYQIAFEALASYGYGVVIDDVSVEEAPACLPVTNLSATNIAATQADLGWTAGGSETAWNIEYGATGFAQGSGTTVNVTSNPYTLTGLTPETAYDFYVQADCGGSTSTWAGPFTFTTLPTCPAPTSLSATNVQSDQADLGWTAGGSETAWNIEYGAAGFAQGSGTTVNVTNNPYTLTGLSPATAYDFYVQADCGSGDSSTWAGPYTFFTACLTESSFPYNYGFEDVATNTGGDWNTSCWSADPQNTGAGSYDPPFRWTVTDGPTPSSATGPDAAHTGTQYAFTEASGSAAGDEAQLISPIFDMSSLTSPQLTFYYHMYGSDMGSLSVDTYDGTTWTNDVWTISGQQQASASDSWALAIVTIPQNTTQFRFRGVRGAGYNSDIAVDDITIMETPACPMPTALSASNIQSDQADLGWTAGGSETAWNIEYGAAGFTQGSGTTVSVTNNPYTLTGLSANTAYDFYVQADCGSGDLSPWAGPYTFTTSCSTVALPYSNDFDNDFDCWTFEDANGDNIHWERGAFVNAAGCYDGAPDQVLYVFYNSNIAMDDWLFSPGFDLTAGQNYTLDFSYSNDGGTTYTEDMDVFLSTGANATDAAAGVQLLSETGINGGCQSFSNTTITVPTSGTYYIAFHGKSIPDQDVLIIDDFAFSETSGGAIADNQIEGVSFYPNPVNNTLNITADKNIELVRVYSITGQEVISTKPESTQTQINMSNLENGVYFVKAQINGELTAFKVVKK